MPEVELLATGEGEYRLHDPDAIRAWMRDRKRRELVDRTTTAADAVARLVADGDYISFDFPSFTRGPHVLIREVIRQRRRNLWYRAKLTLRGSPLVAAHVEQLGPPSARETEIVRDQIDPGRTVIGRTARS